MHDRQTGATTRISVDNGGNEGNGFSCCPTISGNGRFASYASGASNLVANDTNGVFDLFVHDLLLGVTTRVSVDSSGAEGDGSSCCSSSVSADGLLVAFRSASTNLVLGDTNATNDLFVHDRLTGVTTRVSVDSNGGEANNASSNAAISADGRFVAFGSEASNLVAVDTNAVSDFFLHDRQTGATTRVSVAKNGDQGNDASLFAPAISADGRIIAFPSEASNLVGGDTNSARDVFVHDRLPTPQQAFDIVAVQLNTLLAARILNRGQANALMNKLSAMLAALAKDNVSAAIGKLGAFLNQLNALVAGGVLSAAEAQPLRDTATDLLQRLNG